MNKWIKPLVLTLAMGSFYVAAGNEVLEQQLQKLGMKVNDVSPSPIKGLVQVMTDRGLFYTTEDGAFLIHGRVYNMNEGMKNETESALSGVRLKGVEQFAGEMIEYPAKDEKYKVSVFTDITCGYCRKLHAEMEEYNALGITVQYLAFPRAVLNGASFKDMESVWCAKNPQEALTDAKASSNVKDKSCKTTVAQQYEFGQTVGVTGTPAIILEDGSMIPGYQPPKLLLKVLQQGG